MIKPSVRQFFIADLHFGDKSVLKEPKRPFESLDAMADEVTRRWNELVTDEDIVWVLGDVAKPKELHRVANLKGEKRLVAGNNDGDLMALAQSGLFKEIHGVKYLPGMVLTHVPVHPRQVGQYIANIHGHLHSAHVPHDRYLCVSVDQTGYRPITLEKVQWLLARSYLRRYPMPEPTTKVA